MTNWSPFVEPAGGMMALLSKSVADKWQGALGPPGETTDYDKLAQAVGSYASICEVYETLGVVLAGDRTPTSWKKTPGGMVVLRVVCGQDDSILFSFAEQRPKDPPHDVIENIFLAGEYRLIDIAGPAEDANRIFDTVKLPRGHYRLITWEATPNAESSIILHRLELVS